MGPVAQDCVRNLQWEGDNQESLDILEALDNLDGLDSLATRDL